MGADWALIAARTLHLTAILQAAGAALALAWFANIPAVRRLAWAALGLGVLSGSAWLALQAAAMGGPGRDLPTLGTALTGTRFGHAMLARAYARVVFALLLGHDDGPGLLPPATIMAASLVWGGHAAAGTPAHLAADIAHLLAAAAWVGGLLPLILALRAHVPVGKTLRRFSSMGMAAVGVLAATGIVNTLALETLPGLVGTPHGHWLLVKLGLFTAMLGLAARNRFVLTPRGEPAPLVRATLVETGLAVMLLAVVGLLGTLPPGRHADPRWPFPWRPDQAWPPKLVPATPLSYAHPPRYTAAALVGGKRLHAAHCAGCHTAAPKATNAGDIAWWATHGHAEPVLPEGAEGWSVAQALLATGPTLTPLVGAAGVPAPDFDYDTPSGEQGSLAESERITLLVFFDGSPASDERLNDLALRRRAIQAYGVRLLAIDRRDPRNPAASELSVAVAPEVPEAFSLLVPGSGHTEMLLDRAGIIRAAWHPGDQPDWRTAKTLSHQLARLAIEAMPSGNGHNH